jgi:hypothetical protein
MQPTPTPDEMRAELAQLDTLQQKVAGALMPVLFQNADKLRDREWVTEQLSHVTLLALELDREPEAGGVGAGPEDLARVQAYVRDNREVVLNSCFRLFLRVGEDMAGRAEKGFSLQEATVQALGYMRM